MTMKYRFFNADTLLANPLYNPDVVLNMLMAQRFLKNDAALSRALDVAPPVISKIRHRVLPITAWVLLRIHHLADKPVDELRLMMGDSLAVDDGNS